MWNRDILPQALSLHISGNNPEPKNRWNIRSLLSYCGYCIRQMYNALWIYILSFERMQFCNFWTNRFNYLEFHFYIYCEVSYLYVLGNIKRSNLCFSCMSIKINHVINPWCTFGKQLFQSLCWISSQVLS